MIMAVREADLNICTNCRFYREIKYSIGYPPPWWAFWLKTEMNSYREQRCARIETNPVSGGVFMADRACSEERSVPRLCGEDGRFFEIAASCTGVL